FKQSNLNGFLSGAAARTVQEKLREFVTLDDFMSSAQIADVKSGALAVDMSTVINNVVDLLGDLYDADGIPRVVVAPAGTFRLDSAIAWRSGVGFKGAGMGATILKPQGNVSAIDGNQNGTQTIFYDDCLFEDFTIDGEDQTGATNE